MYSPFRDDQGRQKTLSEITWNDLAQLTDLDEGYVLEFKQAFTTTVKRKIPKIIASFANSRGGWIVIGIADDTHRICPIPRAQADFSQTIGEICRRHITPAPAFDMRFLSDPAQTDQGVLIIQVAEGAFPPYVADGVVEIREGSTSGPATGSALVELYSKATRRQADITEFCHRTVYIQEPVPLFDLYFYQLGRESNEVASREIVNGRAATMTKAFSAQGLSCHVQHAHDSLIFRASIAFDGTIPHSVIELFGDESIKLTVPAVLLDEQERMEATDALHDAMTQVASFAGAHADAVKNSQARIMSARDTLRRVTRMAAVLDRYMRMRGGAWQTYAVAYELENMAGIVLWSDDPIYLKYVAGHGPLFCGTTDCRSRVRYLDDGEHDSFRARQFAGSHFFEACGLPLGSPNIEDNKLVDALLRTEHDARKS